MMSKKLNILMISSEMVPFAKTGGLADVVGALPVHLKKMGHDVRVVIPNYSMIPHEDHGITPFIDFMNVWMGTQEEYCRVHNTMIKNDVPVYLIEHDLFFNRWGIYHDSDMNDYTDNPKRFSFLAQAGLKLAENIDFKPDIVHVHDWQSALAAAYLKIWHWENPVLGSAASVLTIHNAAYRGIYPKTFYDYIGLGKENFNEESLEMFGAVDFLKGGIFYSDLVTTVSPSYGEDIKRPFNEFGLAPNLANKGKNFYGILNGVDYEEWSPEIDSNIAANFSKDKMLGKKKCKADLQKRFNLEVDETIPVIGAIGRFVDQKGFQNLAPAIRLALNDMRIQFVILGSGDSGLEHFYRELPSNCRGRAGSYIGYNNELSHIIEAGCDFFIMPSLYEPCGLNQMYSMKYGTLPIVRATGGLNDTVENYDEASGSGTGFKFFDSSPQAVYYTIGWAVSTYYDRKEHMKKMISAAMSMDFSWDKSAREYEKAYERAIENKMNYDKWPR